MKKTKSTSRRRTAPTRNGPKTVDEYFAHVPEAGCGTLTQLRAAIRSALPQGTTEIISYKMPAFKADRVLVWYAAFADHCSLFPGASVIEQFKDELTGFKTSKGTVQFPFDKPLPVALIKRIVNARLAEHEAKARR